jgi:hypothetical protein
MVETVIINTLRGIGGIHSAEVLIGAIRAQPEADWVASAKSALQSIDAATSDPKVKRRIRSILR